MQGNASDLMHGLPLQSVNKTDQESYHEPARLTSLIYAPKEKIADVILQSPKLKQLVANEWIFIYCLDPLDDNIHHLDSDMNWL